MIKKDNWVICKAAQQTSLGKVIRVSEKHGWADVEWIIGTRKRMKIESLEVVA